MLASSVDLVPPADLDNLVNLANLADFAVLVEFFWPRLAASIVDLDFVDSHRPAVLVVLAGLLDYADLPR